MEVFSNHSLKCDRTGVKKRSWNIHKTAGLSKPNSKTSYSRRLFSSFEFSIKFNSAFCLGSFIGKVLKLLHFWIIFESLLGIYQEVLICCSIISPKWPWCHKMASSRSRGLKVQWVIDSLNEDFEDYEVGDLRPEWFSGVYFYFCRSGIGHIVLALTPRLAAHISSAIKRFRRISRLLLNLREKWSCISPNYCN